MRDKLIKLIGEACTKCLTTSCRSCSFFDKYDENCEDHFIADYLIANGVTIKKHEEIDFDYEAED